MVTKLSSEIHDTRAMPVGMSKSIFIAIPKKLGATDCELHRAVSLMSHMTKILLRILMQNQRQDQKSRMFNTGS